MRKEWKICEVIYCKLLPAEEGRSDRKAAQLHPKGTYHQTEILGCYERIPLSELFKILETVKANEAERQDSLPESALTEFSTKEIGMEAANLILAGRLGYRWKAQYMDDYGMWILGEKDGEDNEAEA